MREPASLLHRFCALLLLLGLLALTTFFVINPIRDTLAGMDRRLSDDAAMIDRLQAGADSIDAYRDAFDAVETAVRSDQRFLMADSAALASALLQQIIRQPLQDAGATLRSVQDLPADRDSADFTGAFVPKPIKVRVTVVATYPQVLAALSEIEAATPYLFVDQVRVQTPLRSNAQSEWPALSIRFDVAAYMPPTVSTAQ